VQITGCSVWFNNSFYDNVDIRRRGLTSMNWPKPKVKLESKAGSVSMSMLNTWWQLVTVAHRKRVLRSEAAASVFP
jgi:hypothetical protein